MLKKLVFFTSLFFSISALAISTPSYVSVSMNGTTVTLDWGTVSGASYYQLQYRDGYGSWGTSGGSYYGGTHNWTGFTGTLQNRNYRMRACDSNNVCSSWSSASNWISTPLPIPGTPSYVSVSMNNDGTESDEAARRRQVVWRCHARRPFWRPHAPDAASRAHADECADAAARAATVRAAAREED